MEKQLQHPQLGMITMRKIHNARNINITLRAENDILITMPYHVAFEEGIAFLNEKAAWIRTSMQRMKYKKENRQTVFTPETIFDTYARKLQLQPQERKNVQVKITEEVVYIFYPQDRNVTDPVVQEVIRKALEHAWKVEAHEFLPQRVKELAEKYGFSYGKLSVKNTRSCWGSCTPNNDISLSIHLMHLPVHLIDHIILHELCHTVHKDHSSAFWNLLNVVSGNRAKELSKQMRKHSTRVY